MRQMHVANSVALVLALGLGLAGGIDPSRPATKAPVSAGSITEVRRVRLPPDQGGGFAVADASGRLIPLRDYQRIVSTNVLTDRLLVDLAQPARVLAVSRISHERSPWRWRFAGKGAVDGMGPIEAIVAYKPDLVLMNVYGNDARIDILRTAGIEVFNLGELRGLATTLVTAELIGELLGDGARGRAYGQGIARRMRRVAASRGDRPRRRAAYLTVIAGHIYGGTRGTSYHDVLVSAGLDDVAAARHFDWPQYRAEDVAGLGAEVFVTHDGMADDVCGHPGLTRLPPCQRPGHVLTLPEGLLDDPGVGMLDAAELLFEKAYPGQ